MIMNLIFSKNYICDYWRLKFQEKILNSEWIMNDDVLLIEIPHVLCSRFKYKVQHIVKFFRILLDQWFSTIVVKIVNEAHANIFMQARG